VAALLALVRSVDVISWAELETACASSGNVTLSPTFQMGSYSGAIDFSGHELVILGHNTTLDAEGGFFKADGSKGKTSLELHNVILQNTNADSYNGAAIHADNADVKVYYCTFKNNTALLSGGAAINVYKANVTVYASSFEENTAGNSGGAVSCTTCSLDVAESSFTHNKADPDQGGGAISADINAAVSIYTSSFTSNSAGKGGAIRASETSLLQVTSCRFDSNIGTDEDASVGVGGGAVLLSSGSSATFTLCNFTSNTATVGGAVYSDGITALFRGCEFNGNNGTTGNNGVARCLPTIPVPQSCHVHGGPNVTFACGVCEKGEPVMMQPGEYEITAPPPASLKCTATPAAALYFCSNGQCIPGSPGVTCQACVDACA
jgi:predicted outer membrane repeat protein